MSSADEIWKYYLRSVEALTILPRLLTTGAAMAPSSPLFARSTTELNDLLREMRLELELEVCLALMAAFEGILVRDCRERREGPASDALATRMRRIGAQPGGRLRLDDVLEAWKDALGPASGKPIGLFKQAVHFRHWLAHGRVGTPRGSANFAPRLVVDRARGVQRIDPRFPRRLGRRP